MKQDATNESVVQCSAIYTESLKHEGFFRLSTIPTERKLTWNQLTYGKVNFSICFQPTPIADLLPVSRVLRHYWEHGKRFMPHWARDVLRTALQEQIRRAEVALAQLDSLPLVNGRERTRFNTATARDARSRRGKNAAAAPLADVLASEPVVAPLPILTTPRYKR